MMNWMPFEDRKAIEANVSPAKNLDKATLAWAIALGKSYGAWYFSDRPMNHFVTILEKEWFALHARKKRKVASKKPARPRARGKHD